MVLLLPCCLKGKEEEEKREEEQEGVVLTKRLRDMLCAQNADVINFFGYNALHLYYLSKLFNGYRVFTYTSQLIYQLFD